MKSYCDCLCPLRIVMLGAHLFVCLLSVWPHFSGIVYCLEFTRKKHMRSYLILDQSGCSFVVDLKSTLNDGSQTNVQVQFNLWHFSHLISMQCEMLNEVVSCACDFNDSSTILKHTGYCVYPCYLLDFFFFLT